MKQIAIIGPTASGKSDVALQLALNCNAYIFSIDSLSIYKEIDIASAKPSKTELSLVRHFAIDMLYPHEKLNVFTFINEYKRIQTLCQKEGKNLIIVGGSTFYLKAMLSGISEIQELSDETILHVKEAMQNPALVYKKLYDLDSDYMRQITPNDSYRIEKMYSLYTQTKLTPTEYFTLHPPTPTIEALELFNIEVDRATLKERIALRTAKMVQNGLIDEICYLERQYGRALQSMNAIGIVEVLEYLDAKITKAHMQEKITTHTAQLAKRQQTFNKSQFSHLHTLPLASIYAKAITYLQ